MDQLISDVYRLEKQIKEFIALPSQYNFSLVIEYCKEIEQLHPHAYIIEKIGEIKEEAEMFHTGNYEQGFNADIVRLNLLRGIDRVEGHVQYLKIKSDQS